MAKFRNLRHVKNDDLPNTLGPEMLVQPGFNPHIIGAHLLLGKLLDLLNNRLIYHQMGEENIYMRMSINSHRGADGGGEAPPRLILGCSEIINFPKRVPTPARLAEKHSRLATFCSQLTGNLLVCGPLDQE